MMLDHLRRLARYNEWANRRLHAACRALPPEEYHRPRPAFFGSIHGTLSHLLVGDRLWLDRLAGRPPRHARLDEQPWATLDELDAARRAGDDEIAAAVAGLTEADLRRELHYATTSGQPQVTPVADVLLHVFNHQTHHRGQVHDQLSQTNVPPPPLDLIFFLREEQRQQQQGPA